MLFAVVVGMQGTPQRELSRVGFFRRFNNWFQLRQAQKAWPTFGEEELLEGAKQAYLYIHENVTSNVSWAWDIRMLNQSKEIF